MNENEERPTKRIKLDTAQTDKRATRRLGRSRRSISAPPEAPSNTLDKYSTDNRTQCSPKLSPKLDLNSIYNYTHGVPVAATEAEIILLDYLKGIPKEAKIKLEKETQEFLALKIQAILDDTDSLLSESEDGVFTLRNDEFPKGYFSKNAFQVRKGYHIPPVNASFSKAAWKDVANWFDMDPEAQGVEKLNIKPCDMPRFRLPIEIHKTIIGNLENVRNFYGEFNDSRSELGLDRYFSRILEVICNLFGGAFKDRSEVLFKSELSRGRVEHRLQAWQYINVLIGELKKDLVCGKAALKRQGQVQLEADGAADENAKQLGPVSVPLLALLLENDKIKLLVYHGHSRQFFMSREKYGLLSVSGPEESVVAFKKLSEYTFAIILIGYINALTVFGKESQERAKQTGQRVSTEKWESALLQAKLALTLGRRASRIMDGCLNPREREQVVEADVLAKAAWDRFLAAVECAPKGRKQHASDRNPQEHISLTDVISNPQNWLGFSRA